MYLGSTSSAPQSLIAVPSSSSRETQLSGSSSIPSSVGGVGGVGGEGASAENISTAGRYETSDDLRIQRLDNASPSGNDGEYRISMNVPLQGE